VHAMRAQSAAAAMQALLLPEHMRLAQRRLACLDSSPTSFIFRPMKRLTEKKVFSGFTTAWRLAICAHGKRAHSAPASTECWGCKPCPLPTHRCTMRAARDHALLTLSVAADRRRHYLSVDEMQLQQKSCTIVLTQQRMQLLSVLPKQYLADKAVAGLCEGHDGRRGARALRVGHDGRLAALHGRHRAVGGAQVDAHHLRVPGHTTDEVSQGRGCRTGRRYERVLRKHASLRTWPLLRSKTGIGC